MFKLLDAMTKYQKNSGATSHCLTNAQTFYDVVTRSCILTPEQIMFKVVMVAGLNDENDFVYVPNHMVLCVGGCKLIDPSYITSSLHDSIYTTNLATLFAAFGKEPFTHFDMKYHLSRFVKFREIETKMNNGEFCIDDKTYYDAQIDYLASEEIVLELGL